MQARLRQHLEQTKTQRLYKSCTILYLPYVVPESLKEIQRKVKTDGWIFVCIGGENWNFKTNVSV